MIDDARLIMQAAVLIILIKPRFYVSDVAELLVVRAMLAAGTPGSHTAVPM
jgi:hypothetical protein